MCNSLSRRQNILNKGHFHILIVHVVAAYFENQAFNVAGNFLFWYWFNHLGHGHLQPFISSSWKKPEFMWNSLERAYWKAYIGAWKMSRASKRPETTWLSPVAPSLWSSPWTAAKWARRLHFLAWNDPIKSNPCRGSWPSALQLGPKTQGTVRPDWRIHSCTAPPDERKIENRIAGHFNRTDIPFYGPAQACTTQGRQDQQQGLWWWQ